MKVAKAFIKAFEALQRIMSTKFRSIFLRSGIVALEDVKLSNLWFQLVICICWQMQSSELFVILTLTGEAPHIN